jgi:hypothetical protein
MGKLEMLGRLATNPRWWSFFLQRRVSDPATRVRLAGGLARLLPKNVAVDPKRAEYGARVLVQDGLHMLGPMLSQAQCAELVDYFQTLPVHDPYRPKVPRFLPLSGERPPEAHIAHHDAADIVAAPYLLDLANDQGILDIVGRFLGCKPTIGYMAAWWSYPTGLGPQQAENYHRDVDDLRFVKLFVYLTDVTAKTGPHKYVLRSSGDPRMAKVGRFTDEEVEATFGAQNVRSMTSRAGEGFLEDTYGFHKGQPVQAGHRLLFQVVYTLTPLPYAPRRPVGAFDAGRGHDRWINRLYLK